MPSTLRHESIRGEFIKEPRPGNSMKGMYYIQETSCKVLGELKGQTGESGATGINNSRKSLLHSWIEEQR